MTPERETIRSLSERIETLAETAERAILVATMCAEEARAWQQDHDKKSARLLAMTEDIHILVEAMRWTSTTRHVVL